MGSATSSCITDTNKPKPPKKKKVEKKVMPDIRMNTSDDDLTLPDNEIDEPVLSEEDRILSIIEFRKKSALEFREDCNNSFCSLVCMIDGNTPEINGEIELQDEPEECNKDVPSKSLPTTLPPATLPSTNLPSTTTLPPHKLTWAKVKGPSRIFRCEALLPKPDCKQIRDRTLEVGNSKGYGSYKYAKATVHVSDDVRLMKLTKTISDELCESVNFLFGDCPEFGNVNDKFQYTKNDEPHLVVYDASKPVKSTGDVFTGVEYHTDSSQITFIMSLSEKEVEFKVRNKISNFSFIDSYLRDNIIHYLTQTNIYSPQLYLQLPAIREVELISKKLLLLLI